MTRSAQVVRDQATRQIKEDKRFGKALEHLKTKKGLQKASAAAGRQAASVKLWHDALAAETADTPQVAEGQKEMLDALELYTKGIRRFQKAVRQALNAGGTSGYSKAKAAGQEHAHRDQAGRQGRREDHGLQLAARRGR